MTEEPTLVFSESCPYCRAAARVIGLLDVGDRIRLTPIESAQGDTLVRTVHDGQFVHAPHFVCDGSAYYGIGPVAKKLAVTLPRVTLGGVRDRIL